MIHFIFAALVGVSLLTFAPSPDAAPTDKYEGKVVAVGDGTITLRNFKDGENREFSVDGSTVITRNAKPAQLKDVQVEDKAEITAVTVGEKLIAKTLAALAPV